MQILVVVLFLSVTRGEKTKHRRESVGNNVNRNQDTVDFGHIYRDPEKNKHLFDGGDKLNLDEAYATRDENRDTAAKYMAPRERLLYEKMRKTEEGEATKNKTEEYSHNYYNFEAILDRNLARSNPQPRVRAMLPTAAKAITATPMKFFNRTIDEYEQRTYKLKESSSDWTTCDEFAKKALFHPDDIVKYEWMPFYVWTLNNNNNFAVVHTFKYPTKKLVQQNKVKYGPFLKDVDWNQPKLLLNDTREILLIAKGRGGLFQGVVCNELPESLKDSNTTLSILNIRMKILDPFLAIMYCDDRTSYMMAIVGEEPLTDQDKTKAASILKFRGKGKPVNANVFNTKTFSNLIKEKFLNVERQIEKYRNLKPPRFDLSQL